MKVRIMGGIVRIPKFLVDIAQVRRRIRAFFHHEVARICRAYGLPCEMFPLQNDEEGGQRDQEQHLLQRGADAEAGGVIPNEGTQQRQQGRKKAHRETITIQYDADESDQQGLERSGCTDIMHVVFPGRPYDVGAQFEAVLDRNQRSS